MFFKTLIVALSIVTVYSRVIQVKNTGSVSLLVSVTDQSDITVLTGSTALVTVSDDFSGTISALPADSESTDIPRTKVELTLSVTQDTYSVSLVEGFNLRAKVIPLQGTDCSTALCSANLLASCPAANQVLNTLGVVVACTNSPVVFKTICPKAVVTSDDVANVLTCQAQSYLIIFG
ncbi:thaumatin-like protein [Anoplophora glabripennis]|uniref:Thaumatin-like protein n=1 Tax=Anoplophora glabripennis TaxID=217634 RepID=V5I835_ANOGL|nr:thaumatin-like protein [Anoplophora glabripennis]